MKLCANLVWFHLEKSPLSHSHPGNPLILLQNRFVSYPGNPIPKSGSCRSKRKIGDWGLFMFNNPPCSTGSFSFSPSKSSLIFAPAGLTQNFELFPSDYILLTSFAISSLSSEVSLSSLYNSIIFIFQILICLIRYMFLAPQQVYVEKFKFDSIMT